MVVACFSSVIVACAPWVDGTWQYCHTCVKKKQELNSQLGM
jgi:hypothetical protein